MFPFTTEEVLDMFGRYNEAIWPMQPFAYGLGFLAVLLARRPGDWSSRLVAGTLVAFWLWIGLVYFGIFNRGAWFFGLLFVLEAGLLLEYGACRPRLAFRAHGGPDGLVGGLFIAYVLVGYPLLGLALGQGFPRMPVFGVAPCPVTIFTFGLLLWTERPVPRPLLVIPLLWSLYGVITLLSVEIGEDVGLVVTGLLGTALLLWRVHRAVGGGVLRRRAV